MDANASIRSDREARSLLPRSWRGSARRSGVDIALVSDRGPIRDENQDAAALLPLGGGRLVALVADGMGGHALGREAAEIVVQVTLQWFRQAESRSSAGQELLREALIRSHRRIRRHAEAAGADSMGATAVVAFVEAGSETPCVHLAHVGDSRAYLFRGRSIYRLTSDHSLVGQLVRDGLLDEDDAVGHPDSNIVHCALGQRDEPDPELQPALAFDPGDRLLLCSDGIHGVLRDSELLAVVSVGQTAEQICWALHRAALAAGSEDNLSVICIRLIRGRKRRTTRVEAQEDP